MTGQYPTYECRCGYDKFEIKTTEMIGSDETYIAVLVCVECGAEYDAMPKPSYLQARDSDDG